MKIDKPTLILDKEKCMNNISRMVDKAKLSNIILRPHFKTHQNLAIGNWFRDFNIEQITVSSVSMAYHFAAAGWKDITIAFPLNVLELHDVVDLSKTVTLQVLIDNEDALDLLIKQAVAEIGFYIKIDTGYGRAGIASECTEQIEILIHKSISSDKVRFKGFLSHDGHTYKAKSKDEILNIHKSSVNKLNKLKDYFNTLQNIQLSIGDTPSCSLVNKFEEIDEIRPGNFVFYDLMQHLIGSCNIQDVACIVVCPVVSVYKSRSQVLLYGGGVHLSKEVLMHNNEPVYGQMVDYSDGQWKELLTGCQITSLSQEHGILSFNNHTLNIPRVGEVVGVVPVHICLTVNLLRNFFYKEHNQWFAI